MQTQSKRQADDGGDYAARPRIKHTEIIRVQSCRWLREITLIPWAKALSQGSPLIGKSKQTFYQHTVAAIGG